MTSPSDPRWLSTLAAIEEDLVDDSLVYRLRVGSGAHDGLMGDEGTFTMCSFWRRGGVIVNHNIVAIEILRTANPIPG